MSGGGLGGSLRNRRDSKSNGGSTDGRSGFSVEGLFDRHDADGKGLLALPQFAAMMKPSFDASRKTENEEPPKLYFQNVPGRW